MPQHRILELSRLPKAGKLKSIRFRRNTPGDHYPVLIGRDIRKDAFCNPYHPATNVPRRILSKSLPRYKRPSLQVQAVPKALLACVDSQERTRSRPPPLNPPSVPAPEWSRIVTMSAPMIVAKKLVSKDAVVRRKIVRRVKFALGLIVTRGADVEKVRSAEGEEREVLVEGEPSRDLIRQDWTYVFVPALEVYRMPYKILIPMLREALLFITARTHVLEKRWATLAPEPRPDAKNVRFLRLWRYPF
ncbi:hypothetical protein OE88DRAFT_1627042 [Heliocybe sulcata]|uniref:Uncharacterized protein n=1 Tax=Heliocybe sulcata TaxID=5364 RepID=A0A5C3N9Z0_9AGAM|nr:hypothetical protein OE88DRAFT_1627042 [Heliocybe sulcata]